MRDKGEDELTDIITGWSKM